MFKDLCLVEQMKSGHSSVDRADYTAKPPCVSLQTLN